MARHLLVTLADERFLDPARQLLACVHFDAGWDGDLMLLAHDVPEKELADFEARGIHVRPCASWVDEERDDVFHPPTVLSKFDVFDPELRAWDQIVFLDADMLFFASLEALARVRGLAAVCERRPLAGQYGERARHPELARELESRFDLARPAFNSGLLAFSSDVIEDDTVERLRGLYRRYREAQAHPFGDQPALNLHFHHRWSLLPDFYAAIRDHSAAHFFLAEDRLRMIGKHFAGWPRPWDAESPFHDVWLRNLARFDELDARTPQPPRARWSDAEVKLYWWRLHARRAAFQLVGALGSAWRRLSKSAPGKRVRLVWRRLRGGAR